MNTVWVFGDSYSMDYHKDMVEWSKKYIEFKGRPTKTYGLYIAEELGYEYKNYAEGGFDNYSILEKICDNCEFIKDEDIILIGWGPHTRFRIVGENNIWLPVSGMFAIDYSDLSKQTINEMMVHRNHILFEEEVKKWEKLIKIKFNKNFFYSWCWFDGERIGYETVSMDTKGLITDEHWSENGHKEYAKKIMKKILDWKENL